MVLLDLRWNYFSGHKTQNGLRTNGYKVRVTNLGEINGYSNILNPLKSSSYRVKDMWICGDGIL